MFKFAVASTLCICGMAASTEAFEFRCRFVERIGFQDIWHPEGSNTDLVDASAGGPHRVRMQFGVFDDATGPAPAGGLLGWTAGSIRVEHGGELGIHTRNPGRLPLFSSPSDPGANGNPPLPGGDPFMFLTDIDAELGSQTRTWECDGAGQPLPLPTPIIRGRNTFVSVFEFWIDAHLAPLHYFISMSGTGVAAAGWDTVGTPTPPDCSNPNNPIAGQVVYAPVMAAMTGDLSRQLIVYRGPTPGAGVILGLGGAIFGVRRRQPNNPLK
jgi:hypothetical protein